MHNDMREKHPVERAEETRLEIESKTDQCYIHIGGKLNIFNTTQRAKVVIKYQSFIWFSYLVMYIVCLPKQSLNRCAT